MRWEILLLVVVELTGLIGLFSGDVRRERSSLCEGIEVREVAPRKQGIREVGERSHVGSRTIANGWLAMQGPSPECLHAAIVVSGVDSLESLLIRRFCSCPTWLAQDL